MPILQTSKAEACFTCVKKNMIHDLNQRVQMQRSRMLRWLLLHAKYIVPKFDYVERKVGQAYPGVEIIK